jgi:hypothetical protein
MQSSDSICSSALCFMTTGRSGRSTWVRKARRETRDDGDRAPPDRPKTARRLTGRNVIALGSCGFALSVPSYLSVGRFALPGGTSCSAAVFPPRPRGPEIPRIQRPAPF